MFKKWIDRLSSSAKDDGDTVEFKSYVEEKEEVATLPEYKTQEPASLPVTEDSSNIELKVVRPETMDEVFTIADYLIAGCTVVLNLEILDRELIKRMLDFLNGVTYSTEGEIKNVAKNTYIITPNNVDISEDD